jgi:hypothetical protein
MELLVKMLLSSAENHLELGDLQIEQHCKGAQNPELQI